MPDELRENIPYCDGMFDEEIPEIKSEENLDNLRYFDINDEYPR